MIIFITEKRFLLCTFNLKNLLL